MKINIKRRAYLFILWGMNTAVQGAMMNNSATSSPSSLSQNESLIMNQNFPSIPVGSAYADQNLSITSINEDSDIHMLQMEGVNQEIQNIVQNDPNLRNLHREMRRESNEKLIEFAKQIEKEKSKEKLKALEAEWLAIAKARLKKNKDNINLSVKGCFVVGGATFTAVETAKVYAANAITKEVGKKATKEISKKFLFSTVKATISNGKVATALTMTGTTLATLGTLVSFILLARGVYLHWTRDINYYLKEVKREQEEKRKAIKEEKKDDD